MARFAKPRERFSEGLVASCDVRRERSPQDATCVYTLSAALFHVGATGLSKA
jgi:hypothetical protein